MIHPLRLPTVGALVAVTLATGCGTNTSSTSVVTVTATATATVTVVATPSAIPTTTPSDSTTSGDAPSSSATTTAPPATTHKEQGVDPHDYTSTTAAGAFSFISPSRNLQCGIEDGMAGCQSPHTVTNLPRCNTPTTTSAPIVTVDRDGVHPSCTSQGVFSDPSAKVLPYGSSLTAGDFTCTSHTDGIRCQDNTSGARLLASRDYFGAAD